MTDPAASSSRKRSFDDTVSFPALGEDASTWLPEHNLAVRYGTSLRLMASCSAFLNESEEFNEVDPEGDWEKWQLRVPGAFTLFYAAVVDVLSDSSRSIHCVLRAVLDGWPTPTAPHNPRLIIDYVACRRESRGRGHATRLLELVRAACSNVGANCYVLALEESCPYWVDRGFVLEEGDNLNARLNLFPDTHLLRVQGDPPDAGCADDLALREEDEGEEAAAAGGGDGDDEAADDEEAELQAALALSMAPAPAAEAPVAAEPEAVDVTDGGGGKAAPAEREGAEAEEDDERALQEAIAMSLRGSE